MRHRLAVVVCSVISLLGSRRAVVADGWIRTWGSAGFDTAYGIASVPGDEIVVVGVSGETGGSAAHAMRTDPAGEPLWSRLYGGSEGDWFSGVAARADGRVVAVGGTVSGAGVGTAGWLVQLDASGDVQWERMLDGARADQLTGVALTPDGGATAVGSTTSAGQGGPDAWLVHVDAAGGVTWERTIGTSDYDSIDALAATADGGAVLAGMTYMTPSFEGDAWIVRTDALGDITWQVLVDGGPDEEATAVAVAPDGSIYVAGYRADADWQRDAWLLALAADGTLRWQRTVGGSPADDEAYGVTVLPSGEIAVTGLTASQGQGLADQWILRFAADGTLTRQTAIGGAGEDAPFAAVPLADGGMLLPGQTNTITVGTADILITRVDPLDAVVAACTPPFVVAATAVPALDVPVTTSPGPGVSMPTTSGSSVRGFAPRASLLEPSQPCDPLAPPPEVSPDGAPPLLVGPGGRISWQPAAPGSPILFRLYRAPVRALAAGSALDCAQDDLAAAFTTDPDPPPLGGWCYLVAAFNAAAVGPLGSDSFGMPHVAGASCP